MERPKRAQGRPRKLAPTIAEIAKANEETDELLKKIEDGKQAEIVNKGRRTTATPQEIRTAMLELIEASHMPKVKSLEELIERFDSYFSRCAKNGIYPVMEEMYLYTGYDVTTIVKWLNGLRRPPWGEPTCEVIRAARSFLMAYDAKMVIAGKLEFLTYCFRAKNFYGMTDKAEVVVSANNPMGDDKSQKELERHYIDAIYSVVDEEKPVE